MADKRFKLFSIYKPLPKDDSGAGFQMKWSQDAECIFIEMARQKGPKLPTGDKNQFDWTNKITFKLGLVDIGHILLVLVGKNPALGKDGRGLVHRSEREGVERLTSMSMKRQTGDWDNYALSMSKKEKKGGVDHGQQVRANIYVDHHEAQVMGIMLRKAVEKMTGF